MMSRKILGAIVISVVAGTACGSDSSSTTTPPSSTTFTSTLNAANERPNPNSSAATGSATYVLSGSTLTFTVSVNGLSGPATASHIHVGASTVAGPVIVGFVTAAVQNGNVTSGTIDLTQPIGSTGISGDSLKTLLNNGNAYTNVHTAANGGGEIRGQIIKQ